MKHVDDIITPPKLSVVIPVYGVEQYIEKCAVSLFEQTLDSIEYLFIDDCTPDQSINVVKQVLERYPERRKLTHFIKMDKNSGQAAVRKYGIEHATGEYIIHCDSDDWVEKDIYRKLYVKAKEGDYDMVRCNFARTDGFHVIPCKQIDEKNYWDHIRLISLLLSAHDFSSLCDKIFKRSLFTANRIVFPTRNMQEDTALVAQLLYYTKRCSCIEDVGYYYFNNSNSISHSFKESSYLSRYEDVKANAEIIFAFLEEKGISDLLKDEIVCHKLNVKGHIINLVSQIKYYKMWNRTYPEIKGKVLNNPKIDLESKILYILVRTFAFSMFLYVWNLKKRILN